MNCHSSHINKSLILLITLFFISPFLLNGQIELNVESGTGYIDLLDVNNTQNLRIGANGLSRGSLNLYDSTGTSRVHLFASSGDNGGSVRISTDSGITAEMRTDFFENYGKLQLRNNFNLNVGLVKSETSNDHGDGAVYIYDDA